MHMKKQGKMQLLTIVRSPFLRQWKWIKVKSNVKSLYFEHCPETEISLILTAVGNIWQHPLVDLNVWNHFAQWGQQADQMKNQFDDVSQTPYAQTYMDDVSQTPYGWEGLR